MSNMDLSVFVLTTYKHLSSKCWHHVWSDRASLAGAHSYRPVWEICWGRGWVSIAILFVTWEWGTTLGSTHAYVMRITSITSNYRFRLKVSNFSFLPPSTLVKLYRAHNDWCLACRHNETLKQHVFSWLSVSSCLISFWDAHMTPMCFQACWKSQVKVTSLKNTSRVEIRLGCLS